MDLSPLEQFIPNLAAFFNVQPATILFFLGLVMTVCNIAARTIPDTATGWLGALRKICAFLGAFVQNRVAPGVTVTDVAKSVVSNQASEAVLDLATQEGTLIPDVIEDVVDKVVPAFPRYSNRGPDGKFLPKE